QGLSKRVRTWLFVVFIIACVTYKLAFEQSLNISLFLWILVIYFRGWYITRNREFNLAVFVSILLIFAAIASIKQASFQRSKQEEKQLIAIQKLESPDDPNAVLILGELEAQ